MSGALPLLSAYVFVVRTGTTLLLLYFVMDWIHMTWGKDQWQDLVNMVMMDRIPISQNFLLPSRPDQGLTQPPIQWVPGLSRW